MENQVPAAEVISTPIPPAVQKSNVPWILGLVGFVLSIPNMICALVCAAAAATVAGAAAGAEASINSNGFDEKAAEAAATEAASGVAGLFIIVVIISILCFALGFFGKSDKMVGTKKLSAITGVVMVVGGAYLALDVFIGLSNWLFGLGAAACYIIAGSFSLKNSKL